MTCQHCQEREASVVITKISGEHHEVTHVCPSCASTLNGAGGVAITLQTMTRGQSGPSVTCPSCGKSFADFSKSGLFGCAACYDAFEPHLERLFRRVQGVSAHLQAPPPAGVDAPDLGALERALDDAVRKEAFEEAAALRDRILKARRAAAEGPTTAGPP